MLHIQRCCCSKPWTLRSSCTSRSAQDVWLNVLSSPPSARRRHSIKCCDATHQGSSVPFETSIFLLFFLKPKQTIQKWPHLSQPLGTKGVTLVECAHHITMATGAVGRRVGGKANLADAGAEHMHALCRRARFRGSPPLPTSLPCWRSGAVCCSVSAASVDAEQRAAAKTRPLLRLNHAWWGGRGGASRGWWWVGRVGVGWGGGKAPQETNPPSVRCLDANPQ